MALTATTKAAPQQIGSRLFVRVRDSYMPMGPFRLHMYVLTPPNSRAVIDRRKFPTRSAACLYAKDSGWTVLGAAS